jgi:hypothetical protein
MDEREIIWFDAGLCYECGKRFDSPAGVAQHRRFKHKLKVRM